MAEDAKKVVKKTVNLTGKKAKGNSLVMKAKKSNGVKVKDIKKLNEEMAKKKALLQAQDEIVKNNGDQTEEKKALRQAQGKFEDKKYSLTIGLKDLLKAGSHLGHKVSKTNPKAKENIYGVRDGVQIFDLVKTLECLDDACNFVYNLTRKGKKVILVGTKRQAREVVKRVAEEVGVGYITDRWLGGTISNWEQISKNIKRLVDIRDGLEKGKYAESTKKERSLLNKESIRLEKMIGGLVGLDGLFDAIVVVDAGMEKTAIREARGRKITSIAICDSDTDPNKVDYVIPANDDSVKSVNLIVEEIGRAIKAAGVKK
ncbi:MAG: 30S ribosomal protein S2 [Candidatus Shapirobacteria bacterium GW2011_GWE1_38_92]|uniref:Small ribosomal subunit protein uS2 n=2 Tax=Candidatus Shapironibacteriota TaxID=1752721 RepID=A0A0G0K1P7_9BACT|nr:MAG: 30S ribosomal protein S2 [Candidatus Shapirobacteria bacterium GW2011_GWE2_38_30]KKQ90309.1 MAG: 30S ribosomal protein S2 [Candidatus Shapirobacteria bacterium GW2011_GWE1_38_92]HCU55398.1 30S ribosomal protein S2 [Candidatus Shapirobacteria bacterium]